MMTRAKRFAFNLTALVGAVLGVAGWAAQFSARAIDARYVHVDSFAAHRQWEAFERQRDSLNAAADKRDILRILAGLDSSDRCRRRLTDFCR